MTDWRALCEELADALACHYPGHVDDDELVKRTRAALAQPEPEVRELSDQELDDLADATPWHGSPRRFGREVARAAIAADRARWGRPAPAPAGEVAELVASLRDAAASNERIGATQAAVQLTRAADLLEHLASPACPVLDPSPEVIAALKAAGPGRIIEPLPEDAQVIEPTEHTILVPACTPAPVAERLPGLGDCDEEHYCWRWNTIGGLWARQPLARKWYEFETHWLPAHALPLPGVEVE